MHIQALQYDHDLAEKTLDTTFELWKDMTVLDVVMFAKCESFSEQCCLRILRTMQFGDIKIDGEQGVMWKIFFSLVTGGLAVFIFPNLVEFEPRRVPAKMAAGHCALSGSGRAPEAGARGAGAERTLSWCR